MENFTKLLHPKKSAAEAHTILVETYSDHALSETTCKDWFRHFKNNDFDAEGKEFSSTLKKFEAEELEALLHKDSCQVQAELAESLGVDHHSFKTFESIQNDSKARTLGAV